MTCLWDERIESIGDQPKSEPKLPRVAISVHFLVDHQLMSRRSLCPRTAIEIRCHNFVDVRQRFSNVVPSQQDLECFFYYYDILNSGEVPNLFEPDEIEKIINSVRSAAKVAGVSEQRDQILSFFIRCVQENLHIVLCMSPIGDDFRRRCRMFPSLVNCCTIDWFDPWPTVSF